MAPNDWLNLTAGWPIAHGHGNLQDSSQDGLPFFPWISRGFPLALAFPRLSRGLGL